MRYNLIVACDFEGVIGANGKIPWHFPEDLKFFKEVTMGHTVIMGRKTWESLPKKPLAGRDNYVISSDVNGLHRQGMFNAWSSLDALKSILDLYDGKSFFIGGASIYAWACQNVPLDKVYVTLMKGSYCGDTFFSPKLIPDFISYNSEQLFDCDDYVRLLYRRL